MAAEMDQRSYNQYCATARTLDIVGERWTLLLIRELLTGPKRFSDLQRSLRGLGTGLLTSRLKQLEREGLAQRVKLPPPARVAAYALTEAGADLEPAVLALARWGMKWVMSEPREGESFQPGWAVLGMRACFDAEAAAGVRATYEFRVGDDVFHARVDDGRIDTVHGPAQRPDVVIEVTEEVFRAWAEGRLSLEEMVDSDGASATGDEAALHALGNLFPRPDQESRRPAAR